MLASKSKTKQHVQVLREAGLFNASNCTLPPSQGGPSMSQLRALSRQMHLPAAPSKAALCDELLSAMQIDTAKKEPSYQHVPKKFTKIRQACTEVESDFALPKETQLRISTYELLRDGKLTLDQCDYVDNFSALKLLPKTSASTSWISLGELRLPRTVSRGRVQTGISIKLAFSPLNSAEDNSLEVERRIYRLVTNSLVLNRHTPHVTIFYAELRCNNFLDDLQRLVQQRGNVNATEMVNNMNKSLDELRSEYNLQHMRALITEKSQGNTLGKVIRAQNAKGARDMYHEFDQLYRPVLFQVLYTLAVFNEIGLQHNDLHDDNVFVDVADEPIDDQYIVAENRCLAPNSRFMARIYDFDRGVKVPTEYHSCQINNTLLNRFCERFGQCPALNTRADLFRLMYFIYAVNNRSPFANTYLNKFIEYVVPHDLLQKRANKRAGDLAWSGALCFCKQDGCASCAVRTDTRIRLPQQVLASSVFDQYQVRCTDPQAWRLPSLS